MTNHDSKTTPSGVTSVSPPPAHRSMRADARRRVASRRVVASTYEEAELAVVTAELDGGRERRGGHRERGRRDDGSLRERRGAGRSVVEFPRMSRARRRVSTPARRHSHLSIFPHPSPTRVDARSRRRVHARARTTHAIARSPPRIERSASPRATDARTFLTFSMDATALVETDFFATAVLETTRTPVKEVVKADMMSAIDSFSKVTTRARARATDRPSVDACVRMCASEMGVCVRMYGMSWPRDMYMYDACDVYIHSQGIRTLSRYFLCRVCRVLRRRGRSVGRWTVGRSTVATRSLESDVRRVRPVASLILVESICCETTFETAPSWRRISWPVSWRRRRASSFSRRRALWET